MLGQLRSSRQPLVYCKMCITTDIRYIEVYNWSLFGNNLYFQFKQGVVDNWTEWTLQNGICSSIRVFTESYRWSSFRGWRWQRLYLAFTWKELCIYLMQAMQLRYLSIFPQLVTLLNNAQELLLGSQFMEEVDPLLWVGLFERWGCSPIIGFVCTKCLIFNFTHTCWSKSVSLMPLWVFLFNWDLSICLWTVFADQKKVLKFEHWWSYFQYKVLSVFSVW